MVDRRGFELLMSHFIFLLPVRVTVQEKKETINVLTEEKLFFVLTLIYVL